MTHSGSRIITSIINNLQWGINTNLAIAVKGIDRVILGNLVKRDNVPEIPAYDKVALRNRGNCDMQSIFRRILE